MIIPEGARQAAVLGWWHVTCRGVQPNGLYRPQPSSECFFTYFVSTRTRRSPVNSSQCSMCNLMRTFERCTTPDHVGHGSSWTPCPMAPTIACKIQHGTHRLADWYAADRESANTENSTVHSGYITPLADTPCTQNGTS